MSADAGGESRAGGGHPLVSVIMLATNRSAYLRQAIGSVQQQSLADWELVVIQDGDDRSVREVLAGLAAGEPRLRHWQRAQRGNIADATNFALERVRGQYVAILDDDDYWLDPAKLEKQVRYLSARPDCVGCGGGMMVIDADGVEQMRYLKPGGFARIRRLALFANPMANSTTLFRSSVARAIGGYNVSLENFQDWDFWLRMGAKGELENLPEIFTAYRMWTGGSTHRNQKSNARSALRIVWHHKARYPLAGLALVAAAFHYTLACLPAALRNPLILPLGRLKKRLFSARDRVHASPPL